MGDGATATVISISALIVSAGSLVVAFLSYRHSQKAERDAASVQSREAKADLLKLLSDARIILERSYTRIGAFIADCDGETQPVREVLQSTVQPLREHLTHVVRARDAIEEDWIKFHKTDHDCGFEDIMRITAEVEDKVNDYEHHHDIFEELVTEGRKKLEKARAYFRGAEQR